jgi:hypothetical protein
LLRFGDQSILPLPRCGRGAGEGFEPAREMALIRKSAAVPRLTRWNAFLQKLLCVLDLQFGHDLLEGLAVTPAKQTVEVKGADARLRRDLREWVRMYRMARASLRA